MKYASGSKFICLKTYATIVIVFLISIARCLSMDIESQNLCSLIDVAIGATGASQSEQKELLLKAYARLVDTLAPEQLNELLKNPLQVPTQIQSTDRAAGTYFQALLSHVQNLSNREELKTEFRSLVESKISSDAKRKKEFIHQTDKAEHVTQTDRFFKRWVKRFVPNSQGLIGYAFGPTSQLVKIQRLDIENAKWDVAANFLQVTDVFVSRNGKVLGVIERDTGNNRSEVLLVDSTTLKALVNDSNQPIKLAIPTAGRVSHTEDRIFILHGLNLQMYDLKGTELLFNSIERGHLLRTSNLVIGFPRINTVHWTPNGFVAFIDDGGTRWLALLSPNLELQKSILLASGSHMVAPSRDYKTIYVGGRVTQSFEASSLSLLESIPESWSIVIATSPDDKTIAVSRSKPQSGITKIAFLDAKTLREVPYDFDTFNSPFSGGINNFWAPRESKRLVVSDNSLRINVLDYPDFSGLTSGGNP